MSGVKSKRKEKTGGVKECKKEWGGSREGGGEREVKVVLDMKSAILLCHNEATNLLMYFTGIAPFPFLQRQCVSVACFLPPSIKN